MEQNQVEGTQGSIYYKVITPASETKTKCSEILLLFKEVSGFALFLQLADGKRYLLKWIHTRQEAIETAVEFGKYGKKLLDPIWRKEYKCLE